MNLEEFEKAKHHVERLEGYRQQLNQIKKGMQQKAVSGIYLVNEKGGSYVTKIRDPDLLEASVLSLIDVLREKIEAEMFVLTDLGIEVDSCP